MANGTCLCGALQYEVQEPHSMMVNCHCSMCRKHHGAAFATVVAGPADGLRWRAGEHALQSYQSSAQGARKFCPECGSVAPMVLEEMNLAFAPAGNLEGELGIRPQMHIFVGSKAPWYEITDGLPQHAEYPPEFAAPSVPRPEVVAKPGVIQGSCLCGDVAWEITGAPSRMYNCHCSRCRRARSAAFATNCFFKAEQLAFTRGEDGIRAFKVPGAQYFTATFCGRCGGKVPRVSHERNYAVVPAGALDTDPGLRPQAHIYTAYKASWFEITDVVPQFAELPG